FIISERERERGEKKKKMKTETPPHTHPHITILTDVLPSVFVYIADMEETYDPTGQTCYMEACDKLQVVPASYFLRHMHSNELSMAHRNLGPKGTKALAVPLVTNTSILKLNLRDNWMEGMGGAAIAEMLKENCYITGGFSGHSSMHTFSPSSLCHLRLTKVPPHSHSYATLTPIICHSA
uniref:Leucine rich repeat containing 74A n=1 Tax=Sphaeramia orbicularis TaxID=375764 RepID=A0A672YJA8_9TELE